FLVPLEIDQPEQPFVAAAAMICGYATGIVTPATVLERLAQLFVRLPARNLIERETRAKAHARRSGPISSHSHKCPVLCASKKVDLVTFFKSDVRLFPLRPPTHISAHAPKLSQVARHTDLHNFNFEKAFDRLLNLYFIRVRPNLEQDLIAGFNQQRSF